MVDFQLIAETGPMNSSHEESCACTSSRDVKQEAKKIHTFTLQLCVLLRAKKAKNTFSVSFNWISRGKISWLIPSRHAVVSLKSRSFLV